MIGPVTIDARTRSAGWLVVLPPLLAVTMTVLASVLLLRAEGIDVTSALFDLYIAPVSSRFNFGEVLLKMTPLLLIAQALAIGFRARVWNIGGEGQLILGAIGASLLPIAFNDSQSALMLPAMMALGALFGLAWAGIAAFLRVRFNANEILVTLMLNSIALQLLYYLVLGPLRDPMGFNFPQSAPFPSAALLPTMIEGTRATYALFAGVLLSAAAWIFMSRTQAGFRLRVGGLAPAAADYAGFRKSQAIWLSLLLGGAAAGLAGTFEVAGPLGQLQRNVTPGYGFAAIIVAFLGGLSPIGIFFSAFFMAVVYVGGDIMQATSGVSRNVTVVLQGVLLVSYMAALVCVTHQLRWRVVERAQ